MKRFKMFCAAICLMAVMAMATAAVAATYECYWPDPGGAVGYEITNVDGAGALLVFTYNPVGDIFAYTVNSSGPITINFGGGSMLPAYFYGQYKGTDSLTGKPIYDFYVSGSGVMGSFAFIGTQVW